MRYITIGLTIAASIRELHGRAQVLVFALSPFNTRRSPGSFPWPTQNTGPDNKNTVTKHANYSILLHPSFINLPLKAQVIVSALSLFIERSRSSYP